MNAKLTALLSCSLLLACSGEGGNDSNRNLGSRDGGPRDGATGDGGNEVDGEVEPEDAQVAADAGADAQQQEDDASVQAGFSITVRSAATPIANVPVWFHDATGALLSEHVTDADGRVTSDTTPVMVTALTELPTRYGQSTGRTRPTTFTSLVPGDHIVIELSGRPWTGNQEPRYQLSYPEPPVGSYSLAFAGQEACANASLSETLSSTLAWPRNCPNLQANSLLGIAANEGGEVLGYSFAKGVPAYGSEPVPVTLGAWSQPGSLSLTFQNVSAGVAYYEVGVWSDGTRVATQPQTDPLDADEATRTANSPMPVGYADQIDVLLHGMPNGLTRSSILVRQAPSANVSIDFANRLPRAANSSVQLTDGRPTFTWEPTGGPNSEADAVAVDIGWTLSDPSGEISISYAWLVIGPSDTRELRMPQAPGLFEEFQNVTQFNSLISYVDRNVDEGYRGFLKRPVRPTDGEEQRAGNQGLMHPLYLSLPGVGVARATSYYEE